MEVKQAKQIDGHSAFTSVYSALQRKRILHTRRLERILDIILNEIKEQQ
jgi:hypothetical protein